MAKGKKKKSSSAFEMSRDEIMDLEKSALADLLLRIFDQNKQLSEMLRDFMSEKYGKKTERFENADQLNLFEAAEIPVSEQSSPHQNSAETSKASSEKPSRTKSPRGRNPMASHLARVRVKVGTEPASLCECCGASKTKIGECVVQSRLNFQASSLYIEDQVADIFACDNCKSTPKTAKPRAFDSKVAGPNLIAHIAVSKFADHSPLHRQQQIFERQGVHIARSTMVG